MAACSYCCRGAGAGSGRHVGGMSAGTGQAQCSKAWSMGAVGASMPLQIGGRGITDSVPAPVQRTKFKHDCDDVLK